LIGAVPDASLNMIGRPDDDDPCPYKPEYNIEENDNTVVVFLSLHLHWRGKNNMVGSAEKGGAKHSRLCVTSREQWPALLFLSSVSNCVVYIYIYRKKTLLIFTSSSLCVCVLSSSLSATSRLLWRRNIRRSVPRESKEKCFPFFLSVCSRLYTSV
jgi:hypothetical protein